MADIASPVLYRVLQNPVTAPDNDYTANAEIIEDHENGLCTLCVFPRRSEPFQVGPIIRADLRDATSQDFRVWEPVNISKGV
jgi:hypothetical protein